MGISETGMIAFRHLWHRRLQAGEGLVEFAWQHDFRPRVTSALCPLEVFELHFPTSVERKTSSRKTMACPGFKACECCNAIPLDAAMPYPQTFWCCFSFSFRFATIIITAIILLHFILKAFVVAMIRSEHERQDGRKKRL
eukprot:1413615-Amphidinium_carterae.1